MPGFSESQVISQIERMKSLSEMIADIQEAIYEFLENEEVVSQAWNNLPTDFPNLVDGTLNTDPVKLGSVNQPFSSQQLNQFDTAVQAIADALNGIDITVTTNLGRNIRRLSI